MRNENIKEKVLAMTKAPEKVASLNKRARILERANSNRRDNPRKNLIAMFATTVAKRVIVNVTV